MTSLSPPAASPARRVRPWLWSIVAVCLALAFGLTPGLREWRRFSANRAQRLTDRGWEAWQRGDLRDAKLSLASASALEPDNLRSALLEGRMSLQTGERARAQEIFRPLIRTHAGETRTMVTALYHDALLGTGWWAELGALAVQELARQRAPDPVWLTAAVESLRLMGWGSAQFAQAAPLLAKVDPVSGAILTAQATLNEGRTEEAHRLLATLPTSLPPLVSMVACRLWVRAGEATAARLSLARIDRALSESDRLLGLILLAPVDAPAAASALDALAAKVATEPSEPPALSMGVSFALAQPDRVGGQKLSRRLEPYAQKLSTGTLSAIWLYCGLAGLANETKKWDQQLSHRLRDIRLATEFHPLTTARFIYLVNSVPLRRETIYGLLTGLPASERAGTATSETRKRDLP